MTVGGDECECQTRSLDTASSAPRLPALSSALRDECGLEGGERRVRRLEHGEDRAALLVGHRHFDLAEADRGGEPVRQLPMPCLPQAAGQVPEREDRDRDAV